MRIPRGVPRDASSQLASPILAVALKVIEIDRVGHKKKKTKKKQNAQRDPITANKIFEILIYTITLFQLNNQFLVTSE